MDQVTPLANQTSHPFPFPIPLIEGMGKMGNMGVPFIPNLGKVGKVGKPFALAKFQPGETAMSGQKNICCDGIFIYCDDSGGGPLWELPREEAIRLFRRWLNDSKREHLEYTRLARKEQEQSAAIAKARASFRIIQGAEND